MRFYVNTEQFIALIWTIVSVVLSLIIVHVFSVPTMERYFYHDFFLGQPLSWPFLVVIFFALFLLIAFPVYSFLYLWHASKSNNKVLN